MFEQIQRVPGDAILGLIEAFNNDTNPQKVDLGVGVYRDAAGTTPVMRAVKEAEALLLQEAPIVPIYYYVDVTVFDESQIDLRPNPWNNLRLDLIEKKRD